MKITRRDLLAAGAAGVMGAAAGDVLASNRIRPNIVWLVSEDNNPRIHAYGDTLARTPTIDRLASEGVLFSNVFSTAPVCAPTRFGIITGVHPESAGPAHNMRAEAKLPRHLAGFPQYLREAGYYCSNNSKTDYNCDLDPAKVWNENSRTAHWRNRPKGAPFFAVFNYETTHESRLFFEQSGRVKPEDVRVPGYLPDTPTVRRDIANYYNLMEKMDGELAARLAELDEDGLSEQTIVFYYSDNGGALPRSKRYCYDEGLRCALVVRVPKAFANLVHAAPGSKISSPVTSIDLAPTVLSLAAVPIPSHMQGRPLLAPRAAPAQRYAFGMRNRMDERYDFIRTVTDGDYRYIRNYSPHRIWGQYVAFEWNQKSYQEWEARHRAGNLNADQERFWRTKPFEEFYDMNADVDQLRNLIDAPQHRGRIEAMRAALDAHMIEINDNGFIPEGSPVEGYVESRNADDYPLPRVMALAATAARRTPEARTQLEKQLREPNEIIRYWAAQGLLMLGNDAAPSAGALEAAMLHDPSPQVRIAAAEAMAQFSKEDRCIDVLIELLDQHAHPRVRLQALNALTYVGERARRARAVIQRAAASGDEYLSRAGIYLGQVLDGTYRPSEPVFDFEELMRRHSPANATDTR